MLMIFANMFFISIEVCFEPNFLFTDNFMHFKVFSLFSFILNIFVNLKSSFYEHGFLEKSHKKIRRTYLKRGFFIDFIGIVSLSLSFTFEEHSSYQWLTLLFFIHFKTIKEIMTNFENVIELGDFYELFLVLFKLLFIAHIYACIWHYIAYFQLKNAKDNWMNSIQIEERSWFVRYSYSAYWALTTMVTVGYGDITPKNIYEVLFASFTIMSGSLVFGFCLNRIGSILTRIDEKDNELK